MKSRIYTYFIAKGWPGPIKIGKSKNPAKRLRQLQTASPERLHLVAYIEGDVEKELHRRFHGDRIRGEWFEPEEWLLEWIEGAATFRRPL